MSFRLWIQPTPPKAARTPVPAHVVTIDVALDGLIMGRGRECPISIPYPDISSVHARLFLQEGLLYLEDLGSSNGTWVGERRLTPHLPLAVAFGEPLRLASVHMRVESSGAAAARIEGASEGTETLARRLVADLFCACPPAEPTTLTVERGPDAGKALPLLVMGRRYVVGRGPSCDLQLSDPDISREHVAVFRTEDGIFCEDVESKNGVHREGERIVGRCVVRDGQRLNVGATVIRVLDPEDRYLRQVQEADEEARVRAAKEAAEAQVQAEVVAAPPPALPVTTPASDEKFHLPLRTPEPVASEPAMPASVDPTPAESPQSALDPVALPAKKRRQRSLLPYVVGAVAGSVLLGVLALVVALAFGVWK